MFEFTKNKILYFTVTLFFSLSMSCFSYGQEKKSMTDAVLEGGGMIIEVIKLFRHDNNKNKDVQECLSEICFINKTDHQITVKLFKLNKSKEEKEIILLLENENEGCAFGLPLGIYKYEVTNNSGTIIGKAELNLSDCDNNDFKIHLGPKNR